MAQDASDLLSRLLDGGRSFPAAPGRPKNAAAYLKHVEEIYVNDAYNSLSIEGYKVSAALIEKVRTGNWDPDTNKDDQDHRNALAARGYWQAFQGSRGEHQEGSGRRERRTHCRSGSRQVLAFISIRSYRVSVPSASRRVLALHSALSDSSQPARTQRRASINAPTRHKLNHAPSSVLVTPAANRPSKSRCKRASGKPSARSERLPPNSCPPVAAMISPATAPRAAASNELR